MLLELNKIRRELKLTNAEMSMLLGVSTHTVNAWFTRQFNPSPANMLSVVQFLNDLKMTHNAVGIIVLSSRSASNCEALKTRMIINKFARNNRLSLVSLKTFTAENFEAAKSVSDLVELDAIKREQVKDLVFLAKDLRFPGGFVNELKDHGIRVFHNVGLRHFKIEKANTTTTSP